VTAYLAGVDRAVISEVPVDVVRLAELLLKDKKANPSNYAIMTISEGAVLEGGDMILSGDEDAFGHRKLGGVGVMAGEAIRSLTGEGIINQQVAYLMRSGSPDSLDLMVATNYGVMAADLAHEGLTGRLVVLRSGTYTSEPVDIVRQGVKRVDVDELYDINQYRPKVHRVDGKPMFLY
jgi:6-phosphofructokinase